MCCPAWQITSQSSTLCLSLCVSTVFTLSHHVPKAAESRFSYGAQRGHPEGQNHLTPPCSLLYCRQILTFSLPPLSTYSTHTHTLNITHWGGSLKYNPTAFKKFCFPCCSHFTLVSTKSSLSTFLWLVTNLLVYWMQCFSKECYIDIPKPKTYKMNTQGRATFCFLVLFCFVSFCFVLFHFDSFLFWFWLDFFKFFLLHFFRFVLVCWFCCVLCFWFVFSINFECSWSS